MCQAHPDALVQLQRQLSDQRQQSGKRHVNYSYNSYGKVASRTDAKGQVVVSAMTVMRG